MKNRAHFSLTQLLLLLGFLFQLASMPVAAIVCDANDNGAIDRTDISIIFAARNTPATGPDDPRDINGDGQITINDGRLCVLQCDLLNCALVSANQPPVADAGPDQPVLVSDTTTLDGSGSSDADDDPLTYSWALISTPTGSAAVLSDPGIVNPAFEVDLPGTYVAQLVVNDGTEDSAPDTVTITTGNTAPLADAGPDQSRLVNDTATLDGSGSSDVDGDSLSYTWLLTSTPAGSTATLNDLSIVNPAFEIDLPGTYVAQLVVNDGTNDSAPDTVTITTENSPPVADAGPDQSVLANDTAILDGSGSSDMDGDPLSYSWSLISVPAGSAAALSDANIVNPTFEVDLQGTYIAQLIVNDGTEGSAPDTVTITTGNTPPVADAGPDQLVFVSDTATLDGSGSSDVDGDPLTYSWSLTSVPAGSAAALSDANIVNPTFEVDLQGTYVAQLIVNDDTSDSTPDTVTISTDNTPPVADAGPDQSALITDTATLDGSGSSDIDGDPVTYSWSLTSIPAGSAAALSDPTIVNPTFDVDLPGTYVAQLLVNDGTSDSAPDTVTITTDNTPPVADAGPDQSVLVTDTVTLNGSGSSDVDGDSLTFHWSLASVPAGSAATLSDPNIVNPTFDVDLAGSYVAQLVVNDGTSDSAPDTVTITIENTPPVADAGPDQSVLVSDTVTLDGSGSSDVDGDSLIFHWSLTSVPAGSAATLSDPNIVNPTFDVDLAGSYVAQLVVNDGTSGSAPDTVTITIENTPPVADAGPDQSVLVSDTVTLDGSGSSDVDGDSLSYTWSAISIPAGSTATLDDSSASNPQFELDIAGTYVYQLIVNDGTVNSAPDTVTISTDNSAPTADAGPDQNALVNDTVTLDATGSSDPDGDSLSRSWSEISVPAGSTATLDDNSASNPQFVPDIVGIYIYQLIVSDGTLNSAPDTVTITVGSGGPIVSLVASDADASEAGLDPGEFTLSRVGGDLSVSLLVRMTISGTATHNSDYSIPSTIFQTIPAGETQLVIPVLTRADNFDEPSETVVMTIDTNAAYQRGAVFSDTVTIIDDPAIVSLVASDADASEVGLDPGEFTLSRVGGDLSVSLLVRMTISGTATHNSDYSIPSTIFQTIPAGETQLVIPVLTRADNFDEPSETVVMTIDTNAAYQRGAVFSDTVTIIDDPAIVSLVASDADASEVGLDPGEFTLSRVGGDLSVSLLVRMTISGTATHNSDYSIPSTIFQTIPAGETQLVIPVLTRADNFDEPSETVVMTIDTNAAYQRGAVFSDTVTIIDDPAIVSLVASDADASEVGLDPGEFTLSRVGGDLSVSLLVRMTISGTATHNSDYSIPSTIFQTIPAGETQLVIPVLTRADNFDEPSETVVMTIDTNAAYQRGAVFSDTVTIIDDPAIVSLVASDADASEVGLDPGEFTLSRVGGDLSVSLLVRMTISGTATHNSDYSIPSTIFQTIPAGETQLVIPVLTRADNFDEPSETVVMTIDTNAAYQRGAVFSDTVTIADSPPE